MTGAVSWYNNFLLDEKKQIELSKEIRKIADVYHQIYFNENKKNTTVKEFNGEYKGNILIEKGLVDILLKKNKNSVEEIRDSLSNIIADITKTEEEIDDDFKNEISNEYFKCSSVKLNGVQFLVDIEEISFDENLDLENVAFVFLNEVTINNKIYKMNGRFVTVDLKNDLKKYENPYLSKYDMLIRTSLVWYRYGDITLIEFLLQWVKHYYINDLKFSIDDTDVSNDKTIFNLFIKSKIPKNDKEDNMFFSHQLRELFMQKAAELRAKTDYYEIAYKPDNSEDFREEWINQRINTIIKKYRKIFDKNDPYEKWWNSLSFQWQKAVRFNYLFNLYEKTYGFEYILKKYVNNKYFLRKLFLFWSYGQMKTDFDNFEYFYYTEDLEDLTPISKLKKLKWFKLENNTADTTIIENIVKTNNRSK